jgi:hypothetical protein
LIELNVLIDVVDKRVSATRIFQVRCNRVRLTDVYL